MSIESIGILGAGTMGGGIMINALVSGLSAVLVDRDPAMLAKAEARLAAFLDRQVAKGRMDAETAGAARGRLTLADGMEAMGEVDLAIEAVFEDLGLKRRIFAELEKATRPDAILASNTSCLRIAEIAEALEDPSRLCGMHYFSPAEINPVVELIEGPATAPEALAAAADFLARTGKQRIACKDANGFALNRFFCPYTNEAARLLDEGRGTTGQIDAAARAALELAIGPFAVMNIIGTATNLFAVGNLGVHGAFYAPAASLKAHGAANRPWDIEADPAPLPAEEEREIAERILGAVLLPVSELLSEGVARLEDVDRGAALAFRFGRTPGALMAELGEERVGALIAKIAAR